MLQHKRLRTDLDDLTRVVMFPGRVILYKRPSKPVGADSVPAWPTVGVAPRPRDVEHLRNLGVGCANMLLCNFFREKIAGVRAAQRERSVVASERSTHLIVVVR